MTRVEVGKQFEQLIAEKLTDRLIPRHDKILRMFYGIGYEKPMSTEEIGQHFDVTRERIQNLLGKAKKQVADIVQRRENERLQNDRMEEAKTKDLKGLTVEDLSLSVICYNGLRNAGITHVIQLADVTEAELLRTKNFGRKSLNEVKEVLTHLGMRLKGNSVLLSELNGTQQSDLDTVAAGIKKLPEEESREVSLCLLNLLMPFAVNSEGATNLLRHFRDRLLGG